MSNNSKRPPLLASDFESFPCLLDGRPAWPLARAAGVPIRTFRQRLRHGWSPDKAVLPVADGMKRRGRPRTVSLLKLADGRDAWPLARAAGLSQQTFFSRVKAGWPAERAILPVGSVALGLSPSGRRPGRPPAAWLDALTLPDGRSALAVALASGVSRSQLRSRVLHKMPLVEAVNPKGVYRLADGRPALKVARSVGLSRGQFFKLLAAGQSPDAIIADARAAQAKRAVI